MQASAGWLKMHREQRGWSAAELARRIVEQACAHGEEFALSQQAVSHFENGRGKTLPRWFRWAKAAVEDPTSPDASDAREALLRRLVDQATPEQIVAITDVVQGGGAAVDLAAATLDLVPIASIDLAYGMGGTFADSPVQMEVIHFPRPWLEAMTTTPPSLLTWARGRGDSMSPTIEDHDMVLIDRSERSIFDQDAVWAFTIGDMAMMKRLRVRGEKVTILSDNERVPPDYAHPDEINVVGRVTHIVRRL